MDFGWDLDDQRLELLGASSSPPQAHNLVGDGDFIERLRESTNGDEVAVQAGYEDGVLEIDDRPGSVVVHEFHTGKTSVGGR